MPGAVAFADPYYARASPSLLARMPANIEARAWKSDQDWQDMRMYLEQVLLGMRNWRTPWWLHWGEIAANMLPRRYFFLITPNNMTRGLPINQDVVDSTPTQAITVCAAGLMDGLCAPSKRWVKIEPAIEGFEPDTTSQRWIAEFQQRLYDVLAGSNYYDAKHQMYEDQVTFGSSPMLIYEHRDRIINCVNPCAGEYYLAVGSDLQTNTFYREFTQTIRQIVDMFGPEQITGTDVADLWNTKGANMETERIVAHAIEPNFPASQYGQKPNLGVVPGGWRYREYYWLRGVHSPQPLSVRGFHERPYQCPLWNQRNNDPYGRGLGMDALPDVRQLHQMVRRHNEAVDKGLRPPRMADVGMRNEPHSDMPGRVTYVPNLSSTGGMKPIYTIDPRFVEFIQQEIDRLERRVELWFKKDVWQAITSMEGVQPRNELELNARLSEKLLPLGPVIERNLREDTIGLNRIVGIMARRGLVQKAPASMAGIPLQFKYISKLAQLQRAADTGAMERTISMAGRMEAAMPGTLDNFDKDRFIRQYGERIEFPPEVWSSDAELAQARQQRVQQQKELMMAHHAQQTVPAVAGAAKDLSATDTGGGMNALQMLIGGGGAPGGGA